MRAVEVPGQGEASPGGEGFPMPSAQMTGVPIRFVTALHLEPLLDIPIGIIVVRRLEQCLKPVHPPGRA
jgi:hypothetical protein